MIPGREDSDMDANGGSDTDAALSRPNDSPPPKAAGTSPVAKGPDTTRAERLAAQLKANLKRRKAQQRGRALPPGQQPE